MEQFTSIKEILDKTGKYCGLTQGISMRPIIHSGRDTIVVVKNHDRLKKYDVPVYQLKSGKYVMHRIIEVHDDLYAHIWVALMPIRPLTIFMNRCVCYIENHFLKRNGRD